MLGHRQARALQQEMAQAEEQKAAKDGLNTIKVRAWRDGQIPKGDDFDDDTVRRAKDSTNRNLATLKAALEPAAPK